MDYHKIRGVASNDIVATDFNPLIIEKNIVKNRRFGPFICFVPTALYLYLLINCQRVETRCYKIRASLRL